MALCSNKFLKMLLVKPELMNICRAGAHHFAVSMEVPKSYKNIQMPERNRLNILPKVPNYGSMKPPKDLKRIIDLRGPELVHNELIFKQYGIVALQGGQLRHGHIEMMRSSINRKLNKNMFAKWRIDAPWKPIPKKGQGKRMGGGKGSPHHYTTPIKAHRIIVELGGKIDFEEVKPILQDVVYKLPFKAKVVSYESMIEDKKKEEELKKKNLNPWTFEYVIKNNMQGCHSWIKLYDHFWYGKYE